MRITDERGKLFGAINLIDLLVIVILLGIIIFFAPKVFGEGVIKNISNISGEAKEVYFTVEFPRTTDNFADKINLDDTIKDNQRGYYYGVVSNKEILPSTMISEDKEKGIFVESEVPEFINVRLTVKCNGIETEDEILAEGQPLKLGKQMVLKGKGYAGTGYIIDLYTK